MGAHGVPKVLGSRLAVVPVVYSWISTSKHCWDVARELIKLDIEMHRN